MQSMWKLYHTFENMPTPTPAEQGLPHYLTMTIKPGERSTSTSIHSESEPL